MFTGTAWLKFIILVFEFGGVFEKAMKDDKEKKLKEMFLAIPDTRMKKHSPVT